jgi:hypothetical protein
MKKNFKKLSLHRETLIGLDRPALGQVGGGTGVSDYCTQNQYTCPSFTCYPDRCQYSGRNTCFTCEMTCTTNYC